MNTNLSENSERQGASRRFFSFWIGSNFGVSLTLVMALAVATARPVAAQQWATEMFADTNHAFGTVASSSKTRFLFEFTNKYKETVHVAAVRSSCGCTTPTLTKDTLRSREKAGVLATFNTTSFYGAKSATITVVFDKPFYAEVQLQVSGEILTDVTLNPAEIAFGEISAGREVVSEIAVTFSNRPNLRITDVRSLFNNLKVKLSEPAVSPGRVSYKLRVTLAPDAEPGEIAERLTLVTNDPSRDKVVVGVTGRVRPPVELKPDAVHFDSVASGGTASERLLLRADREFAIEKIDCEDQRVSFDIPEGSKKIHFVKMTFNANDKAVGDFKIPIKIKTDLGENICATCIVTGSVAQ